MIENVEVAEFVDDDVVDDGGRGHHAFPMKGEVAGRGAVRPAVCQFAGVDFAGVDFAGLDADFWREVFDPLDQAFKAAQDVVVLKRGASRLQASTAD
jgi:hypothetical protein